ncbi:hypothetical protein [Parapedobacter tibetensis]|uniref:hypothetical protein n=1 Tax=Parapedobacter tibetensis TaxID=2972951 RepID=UPI002153406D|nr:hypothetical protein [Parapedobacter tibetensis]
MEKAYNNTVRVLRRTPAGYFRMVLVWNRMVKVPGGCRGGISVRLSTIDKRFQPISKRRSS